jgi:AcrR family transcriptional regulator
VKQTAPKKYQLKARAVRQQETRQRIVEATVALHESVGGAGATISAIAERAGVERLTVYRHFPDERALLTACTQHYYAERPPPDPAPWCQIADPETRLRTGLKAVYAYHHSTEAMSLRAAVDVRQYPLLRELLAPQLAHWERVRDVLAEVVTWDAPRSQVRAAVGHAVSFMTWYSLVREQGLTEAQAVELMVGLLRPDQG